jgi:Glycosyl hydrolase family 12
VLHPLAYAKPGRAYDDGGAGLFIGFRLVHTNQRIPSGGRSGHLRRPKAPARASAGRKRRAAVIAAYGAALLGTAVVTVLAAGSAHAATTTLTGMQAVPVAGGAYAVQNDEWGSDAPESITTGGNAGFTVANSSIAVAANGAPGGYPSVYDGCHWGNCTRGGLAGHPVQVRTLTNPGTVTTSWSTTQPGGNAAYDAAYDIWFNQAPATRGQPDGAELMVWLNHHGSVQPFGSHVGTATINAVSYQVWEGAQPWGDTITYVMASPATSVADLDVGALTADAVDRGYIRTSWYLIDAEAGFELWRGGAGLATRSFSVNLSSGRGSPASAPARTPARTPAPSPASAFGVSLQAVSPNPTTPAVATNATVDFRNTGPAVASNVTVVIEVRNSAGTVVGSRSWAGQNVAPHQALNETCTWTAARQAGHYTIEGLVRASSGKTLQQAQTGTVTVD